MQIDERFELGERIGGGATADVHRAFDRELDREVVVRILRADAAADEEYVERFQREAEAASDIRHPNVVEVLDHGVMDGRPFLVRELVQGSTLEELLDRRGALPEEEGRALAEQIARGLEAAHARGVLHRDLNTGRVFVTPEGTAKVADFGMPTAPRHPAPEQVSGKQIDERADVYGIGVVLYQMLTGQEPRERPVPPRRLTPRISKRIEQVALRALEQDPARRYATAAAMANALRAPAARVVRPMAPVAMAPATAAPAAAAPVAPPVAAVVAPVAPVAPPVIPVVRPVARVMRPTLVPSPPRPTQRIVRPIERIARPAAATTPRPRRVSALPFVLIGLPLLLALLIGALTLVRPDTTNTAVLSATATPPAMAAPEVSPMPTSLPPAETTAEPTTQPTPEPTPEPTPAPTPESTSAPAPPPAAVEPAPQSAAAATVRSFYGLIEQKRFDEAAALWSPRMQANYPPSTNIYGRFDRTRQIVIRGIAPVAQSAGAATVEIDILEVLESGVTRHWVGQWQLVSDGSRWLMDAPNLRPA